MALELYSTYLLSDPSLEGYYRFSSNVNDSSSKGRNLSITGSANYTTGVFGNAYTQNSSFSNWLYINNSMGVDGGAITLGIWVKDVNTTSSGYSWSNFIHQRNLTSNTSYGIGMDKSGQPTSLIFARSKEYVGSDAITVNWSTYVSTSTFRFYVLTYDGTYLRAYVDGELVAEPIPASGNGSGGGGSTQFRIGSGQGWDGFTYAANAIYDDAFVLSRALGEDEVAYLYEKARGGAWFSLL